MYKFRSKVVSFNETKEKLSFENGKLIFSSDSDWKAFSYSISILPALSKIKFVAHLNHIPLLLCVVSFNLYFSSSYQTMRCEWWEHKKFFGNFSLPNKKFFFVLITGSKSYGSIKKFVSLSLGFFLLVPKIIQSV